MSSRGVDVFDIGRRFLKSAIAPSGATGAFLLAATLASAQVVNFQIVWVNVGEVAAGVGGEQARAGRQLFMAPQLADFSLHDVTVARVQVEPSLIRLKVGDRFCLTSLDVQASSEDRSAVKDAPLSVSVRQDHRGRLALQRGKQNICFNPREAGEYPIRLNSLLPARDGTTRGAQIFLHVQDQNKESVAEAPSSVNPDG